MDLLDSAYGGVDDLLSSLGDDDLLRPSLCAGWTVADVAYHLLLDAQRALVAFATPAGGAPDVDAVTYWAPFKPGIEGADEHGRFVRLSTAAHSRPRVVVHRWTETSGAVRHAARAADAQTVVTTQEHRLTVADFVSTLVVEAAVHHLDMIGALPDAPGPSEQVLAHVRDVLDRIAGVPAPAAADTADYVLAATGRVSLDARSPAAFGAAADRFPLLG